MFGRRLKVFTLFGFDVHIDLSWIFLAFLIAWSLSVGFFPLQIKDLSARTYWIMGIVGALGLFISIIVHEMTHSLVARRFGMPMKGITLFVFGGVAEMNEEPPNAKAEFTMAIVGPLSSFGIALIFWGLSFAGRGTWSPPITAVVRYLAMINMILGIFNLLPAFPLDGGRVLRSILWKAKNNIQWATRISSQIGSGFAVVLIVVGFFSLLGGNVIGGMWWALIGMFLYGAARNSYQRLLTLRALEGESLERFINRNPVTVPPGISLEDLVEEYVYKYNFKMFPVQQNGTLMGCITTAQIKEVPREMWPSSSVGQMATPCSKDNTIEPNVDATKALARMSQTNQSRLMVVEDGRLAGIVSLKDMLRFLSMKLELEGQ
ncbi:MAG TPA: site-2 protease family protein [Thermodesulfobacteriota bacterium]|nr:site-2 protease family protein [Deltaproteobacteria bacterium]HNU70771.1 site-2 protease family protein [Thermodesulfobacteriota bacterium]